MPFQFTSNFLYVLLGAVLLGTTSGVLGSFALLRKRALLGDALTHCSLPGVCLVFLLTGSKNPLVLLIGAFASGLAGALLIQEITRRSVIKEDTAIAGVLSVFFGIGIVLLTFIQRLPTGNQAGLDKFLFGQAASLIPRDLIVLFLLSVALAVVVVLAYKEFKMITFDPGFAQSLGFPVARLDILLATLVVVCVVIGLQLVGVVLMAAMLITPAAAARHWCDRLLPMLILAAVFGAVGGVGGVFISAMAPRMPTGPWIVVCISLVFIFSVLAAPNRGLLARLWRRWLTQIRTAEENVLKTVYKICETRRDWQAIVDLELLLQRRRLSKRLARWVLNRLRSKGYIDFVDRDRFLLTPEGLVRGQRVVRLHRLWEVYLTQKVKLPPDHVDRDADEIEHIITPELERELEKSLSRPAYDPHGQTIPRSDIKPEPV